MTSWATSIIDRLIWASSSVASESPVSNVNPAAPTNAVWTLIRSKTPEPIVPTTDKASQRTQPPGRTTAIPGQPASSDAIRRPFVTTVNWLQPPRARRARASWSPVVLASIAMHSPSVTRDAAAAPMAAFSARCMRSRMSNDPSDARDSMLMAPPCARVMRPCATRTARSLRMVCRETPNWSLSALTRTRPWASTSLTIARRRSLENASTRRASTSPRASATSASR